MLMIDDVDDFTILNKLMVCGMQLMVSTNAFYWLREEKNWFTEEVAQSNSEKSRVRVQNLLKK